MKQKITSFTQLTTWQHGHQLVLAVYQTVTNFPKHEQYALSDQMRRCAVSITSNIAEGFSRQSKKEKIQFYYTAKGSLTELQNQLLISRDVGYLSPKPFQILAEQTTQVQRLLVGLIKSAQNKQP